MVDALMLQNDVGDVQTALTILIVMGEARQLLPIEDVVVVSRSSELYSHFASIYNYYLIGALVSHLR